MKFIQGQNRNQITLFPVSLDQPIDPDNEVRLIDLFVKSLSLNEFGFRATVEIAKHFGLIDGRLIAGDSTQLRARNNKKDNFNQTKIDRHLACVENNEYNKALSESDEGRLIYHSEYAEYYERNLRNTRKKEHLHKQRQAIVGQPYGTIKRQWGFNYVFSKKGIVRTGYDVGFMFIAYNLRWIGNILTQKVLKEYLRILVYSFFRFFTSQDSVQ